MKTVVPWVGVAVMMVAVAILFSNTRKQAVELAALRANTGQVEELRRGLTEAADQRVMAQDELERFRRDNADLARLRNEVNQLRQQKEQWVNQAQAAQQSVSATAQQQAAQAQQLHMLLAENQRLRAQSIQTAQAQQVHAAEATQLLVSQNSCVNNLRQLDGAKQQWALENRKTAEDMPTVEEVRVYLRNNELPVCPAGGAYTLNAVAVEPVCSIPGHVLPK
jgi:myosin heavy subunit